MKTIIIYFILSICLLLPLQAQTTHITNDPSGMLDHHLVNEENEGERNKSKIEADKSQFSLLKASSALPQAISAEQYSYTSLLDSTLITKFFYTYNASGSKLKDTQQSFDHATSQWYNSEEADYVYDANNLLTLKITKQRSGPNYAWENSSKEEFSYDSNGNITLEANYYHDGIGWVGSGKIEYQYHANNNQLNRSHFNWENGDWLCYRQYQYEYDQWGNRILSYWLRWDNGQSQLLPYSRYEYQYNSDGNMVARWLYRYWNTSTNDWDSKERYNYQNDIDGNWTHCDKYEMTNSTWMKMREGIPYESKGIYMTDWIDFANGQQTTPYTNRMFLKTTTGKTSTHITSQFSANTDSWQEVDKDKYAYDTDGRTILSIDYNWDTASDNWVGNTKYEYAYDAQGRQILDIYYRWNDATMAFYLYDKWERAFDANGNEVLFADYYYASTDQQLHGNNKILRAFNTDQSLCYESRYLWDYSSIRWEEVHYTRTFYTYNNQPTSSMELNSNNSGFIYMTQNDLLIVRSFQPVNEAFTIELYDMNGSKVLSEKAESSETEINTTHLSPGAYLIRNSAEPGKTTKIVIQ